MRILTILMGAMFVVMGVFCIGHSGVAFMSLAFIIGIVMIIFGVVNMLIYIKGRGSNRKDNNSWICVDAIMTFALGILTLCDQMEADISVIQVFSMWILFSGVMRVVMSSHINISEKRYNFMWTLGTGTLCILAGVMGFINPLLTDATVPMILGIFFIVEGIGSLELGFHMPHATAHSGQVKSEQKR